MVEVGGGGDVVRVVGGATEVGVVVGAVIVVSASPFLLQAVSRRTAATVITIVRLLMRSS